MDFKYKQLEQELSALSKVFSELGVRLSEVAKEVTAPGVNPSEKLIEQISATRASFESVRSAIHGHATAMLVSPLPKLGELVSIATIDSLFKASAVAEENKLSIEAEREKALAILGRALSIIHRETADFKPLQECHTKIGELRNAVLNVVWPHRHPESESIIGMKHPATAFIHFVENLDHLDDDRWMAFETTITESYGKPLFVAASRGKLALVEDSKLEAQPAASKPAVAPVEAAKPAPAPEPPKPVVAPEKPVEKKVVAEKAPEKPGPLPPSPSVAPSAPAAPPAVSVEKKPAPVPVAAPATPAPAAPAAADKAPQKPPAPATAAPATHSAPVVPIQTTPVSTPEKKPVQTVPPPAPTAHPAAPAASTHVAPHAAVPATPAPAATTASVPPTPVTAPAPSAPVAAAPVALPRPPAPAPPAATVATPPTTPVVSTPAPAAPAAAASNATPAPSPLAVSINSLSALATATEPAEKKPVSAPADALDKQRKEPRLATPAPQPVPKPEPKAQEVSDAMQPETVQQGLGGDGSQRPQRWGFWRGNR